MSAPHPLALGRAPDWAVAWGVDRHGAWADLAVQREVQRMRWIPAGSFMMGSPPDEEGRYDDEGPQHRVTITQGFWLGDTPVTQALWVALRGDNPSRFAGTPGQDSMQRPVEQVSWTDAWDFAAALGCRLPTEAEWEYACRAGTTTATWEQQAWGRVDLDAVAWHAGNSGGSTQPVGQKAANPWGLHDVLGNVYEWCQDGPRDYDGTPQRDPAGAASLRVCRGGSWSNSARSCRAAYRLWDPPSFQWFYRGFRLARGPAPGRSRPAAAAGVRGGEGEPP